ncbi:MAG: pyruvate dehydrogenase (acetyl-transferring) E1 component subunit alpha [Nitrospiria bacterium]
MTIKHTDTFKIEFIQILDETGEVDHSLLPQIAEKEIKRFYESMVLARLFDEKALNLQRQGRLGTYASIRGQEAVQIGAGLALQPSDWWFPAFRDIGISMMRGLPLKNIFFYWSGDERGNVIPPNQNDFPIAIPVGTHIPHAVGAAWGAKIKGDPIAVLVTFGDGATSKGDFHEGMNLAGVFSLPVVFLCQNNQWAISVPRSGQTASQTLAQKAIAYGMTGVQVDGNDVFAVHQMTKKMLEKARTGGGPAFIEAVTYRLGDHTTADDASRYRSIEEVKEWGKKDPLLRLRKYMEKKEWWTSAYEKDVNQNSLDRLLEAVKEYEETPPSDSGEIFDYVFEKPTPDLVEQKRNFQRKR